MGDDVPVRGQADSLAAGLWREEAGEDGVC